MDYDVEEYFNPTVKRNTYDKSDDHYISEQDEVSEGEESKSELGSGSEEEVVDGEYKKINGEVVKEQKEVKKKAQSKPSTVQLPEPVRSSCRLILHVSNLSEETSKNMIEDFFGDAGYIKSVRIPKRRGTNNFAFVEMRDPEGYKLGLTFDGRELDSKNIIVQAGMKNKKHGPKSKGKRKAQNNVKDKNPIKKKRY